MKIAVCSDIHLEFGPLELTNELGVDVLILSGDICVAKKFGPDYDAFFQMVSKNFPEVIYIMGNHEHYNGDYAESAKILRTALERYKNIHFLEKEVWTHNDVTFIGGTLWTDFNNQDTFTMQHVAHRMNDFQCVKNSNRVVHYKSPEYKKNADGSLFFDEKGQLVKIGETRHTREAHFCPQDAYDDHKQMLGYISSIIEGKFDYKYVIVGHHAPSRLSTHPRYKHDVLMNGAYSSELDLYILDHPQIKLWTHGHTHEDFDYMIGSTRIVCNPRGYIGYERRADRFELKKVEI